MKHTPEAQPEGLTQATDLRSRILATAESELEHTNRVLEVINARRNKKRRIPITPAAEYRERLEDQLTDRALESAAQLHMPEGSPLIPVAPLPVAISALELIVAIDRSSRRGLIELPGRLRFLSRFPVNALTGFDEERAEKGALALVETAYNPARKGTHSQQLVGLHAVQEEFPEIVAAPTLVTAILGQRHNRQPQPGHDTTTRSIEVDPVRSNGADFVVAANIDSRGYSYIDGSSVQQECAARWQVNLEA